MNFTRLTVLVAVGFGLVGCGPSKTEIELRVKVESLQKEADELRQHSSETLKATESRIESLLKQAEDCKAAREKAEKELERFRKIVGAAYREFNSLDSLLSESIKYDDFKQRFLTSKMESVKLADQLPAGPAKENIEAIIALFSKLDGDWNSSIDEMSKINEETTRKVSAWPRSAEGLTAGPRQTNEEIHKIIAEGITGVFSRKKAMIGQMATTRAQIAVLLFGLKLLTTTDQQAITNGPV